jgi:hypothetical protein
VDPFKAFTWNPVSGAQAYDLTVGATAGANDIFESDQILASKTATAVSGMLPNNTYYVRFWVQANNEWQWNDSVFQTGPLDPLPGRDLFYQTVQDLTAQVRQMTIDESDKPSPGSLLAAEVADRGYDTNADCVDYSIVLIDLLLKNRIGARRRNLTLNGTDTEAHTLVEYYDPFLAKWAVVDPNFGYLVFDDLIQQGESVEQVSQHVVQQDFGAIKLKFVTQNGADYLRDYYMDVLSLYLNPAAPGAPVAATVQNDPHAFLLPHEVSEVAGVPGFYLFEFTGTNDSIEVMNSQNGMITLTPISDTLWGEATFLYQGWQYTSSIPSGLRVYTFPRYWTQTSMLISPGDGEHVDPSTPVVFSWTKIPGAQAYYLCVGTQQGAKDVYDSGEVQSNWLSFQLQAGRQYYTRLWTKFDGVWSFRDTAFQTADSAATLLSPSNGASHADASRPIQLTWTALPDAVSYTLHVGTFFRGQDVYSGDTSNAALAIAFQPNARYYVELLTNKVNGSLSEVTTFRTVLTPAYLSYPTDGAVNVDPSRPVQLTWSGILNVQAYYVYVGTSLGARDVYDSAEIQTTAVSITANQNTQYYVRLWTKANGFWYFTDSTFRTGLQIAQLVAPSASALNVSPAVQFSWTNVPDAQTYYLYVGTNLGAKDAYDSGEILVMALTLSLKPNTDYYARLWTKKANAWYYVDGVFQTGSN